MGVYAEVFIHINFVHNKLIKFTSIF